MNIEQARFNMIEQQIRPWNVLDQGVLDTLAIIKREMFVPSAYKNLAFADIEIPLPCGENMLEPKLEARMLQEAAPKKHEHVLEIGTGSGYMTALLAHKSRHVTSVEIHPELKAVAEKNLLDYGVGNIQLDLGNGSGGWPGSRHFCAPYDVIVITGSMAFLPDSFLRQLKIGGRIVAITGEAPLMTLKVITRVSETAFDTVKLLETDVTPLREAPQSIHFKF